MARAVLYIVAKQNKMKMKRRNYKILALLALLVVTQSVVAGEPQTFTLEESMRYATENNNSIKIQQSENLSTTEDKKAALASLFPSLNGYSSLTNSYGRSIDPETNTYTNAGNLSNYYSLYGEVTIFGGLSKINTLKASKVRVESGEYSLQQQMDQSALSVMQLFYDALYFEESVAITKEQLAASEQILELTERQLTLGLKSESDVALAAAEVASYDLLLTQAQSNYDQTILNLKEAMNFPLSADILLVGDEDMTLQDIIPEDALEYNPEVLGARSSLEDSELQLKIARASYLPSLSAGVGYNTNYYKMLDITSTQTAFNDQLKNNYGYYFAASLSVPIFNGLSSRTAVARSKNNIRIARLNLEQTELRVEKAVRDALLIRENSLKEHISAEKKVDATTLASRAMTKKYEQGQVSILELQESTSDLLVARAEELRAKFNYKIQCIMINYYNGEKIY